MVRSVLAPTALRLLPRRESIGIVIEHELAEPTTGLPKRMAFADWPIEEQLRSVFLRRMTRGHALDVLVGPSRQEVAAYSLMPDESPAVLVHADTDRYLLTSHGVHLRRSGQSRVVMLWESLDSYAWISHDRDERIRRKATHFDVLILTDRSGRDVELTMLAQAVFPLMSFVRRHWPQSSGTHRPMTDRRRKRDLHGLDERGMLICNPRDREAAHRAEVERIATDRLASVTCRKCLERMTKKQRRGGGRS